MTAFQSARARRVRCVAALLFASLPVYVRAAGTSGGVALFKMQKADAMSICDAAAGAGLGSVQEIKRDEPIAQGTRLIVVPSASKLTDDRANEIGEAVRNGASLLVVIPEKPGKDAFNLSFALPTMAWAMNYTEVGPFTAAEFDSTFFGSNKPQELQGLAVPYLHQIRPFHAVERGQARYDELERQILFTADADQKFLKPGSNEWTRPLLNRDWQTRVRASGVLALPLLITGEYGRGHVAVFASGADALDSVPQGKPFWSDTMKWLAAAPAGGDEASEDKLSPPTVTVDRAHRSLHVEVKNPGSTPLHATLLARELTWEPAFVRDVQQPITVPARQTVSVDIPLPANDATAYAAVAEKDVFVVRLGVISADGSTLLNEQRVNADLRPPVTMRLDTDDVRTYPWTFGLASPLMPEGRMGTRMDEYAYKPGETIHTQVTFDNGPRNIARLATPADETTPANPTIAALNDGFAAGERGPDSSLRTYGAWQGVKGKDNVVTLTFPQPVLINAIDFIAAATTYRQQDKKNPAAAIVQVDGKEVAREMKLSDRFLSELGDVRIPFDAVHGKVVRIELPWQDAPGRTDPTLGDIQVWGTTDDQFPAAAAGTVSLSLYDSQTDQTNPIVAKPITVAPGAHMIVPIDLPLPANDPKASFYKLVATFADAQQTRPVMVLEPKSVLASYESLHGKEVAEGFIVTRGFRNVFKVGTGTAEIPPGWATPDDLVWGYEHGMKENGDRSPYQASKLFVSENDMRHYSTQWRHFANGEAFYDIAAPHLVANYEKLPGWADADTAVLGHSDRWDSGPPVQSQFSWPEFIAFDQWLRAKKLGELKGQTKKELVDEVTSQYIGPWYAYHLEQYEHSVGVLKDAFTAAGKKLLITAQGCPLVPPKFAETICDVIRGTSDDSTWGMQHDDNITTTGKQMGAIAFNPYLQMCTLCQWQYNSNTLNNPQWHVPAGTTEPSRRHQFDRAFRGVIRMDGSFTSMHSYGFNSNAGDPETLTSTDYDQWKRVRDLFALMQPDAPVGAGLVIGNSYLNDPNNTRFAGSSPEGSDESHAIMTALGKLERSGLSVPFSANIVALDHWTGKSSLIVLNLQRFTPEEIEILKKTMERGVHVAAFYQGDAAIPADAAALFGVDPHGAPTGSGKQIGTVGDHPIVSLGNAVFVPLAAETMQQEQLDSISSLLIDQLALPVRFDAGSTGYAFTSNGREFIEVEDWREEARTLHVRVHCNGGSNAVAVDVNDSVRLPVKKDGSDWLIDLPTRPGDGNLISLQEN